MCKWEIEICNDRKTKNSIRFTSIISYFPLSSPIISINLIFHYRYNFTFPLLYGTNDNKWHVVAVVLHSDATINFYLDGVTREGPKLTKGVPGSNLYNFVPGQLHIGYFKVRITCRLPKPNNHSLPQEYRPFLTVNPQPACKGRASIK